jgi:hypothetical protein
MCDLSLYVVAVGPLLGLRDGNKKSSSALQYVQSGAGAGCGIVCALLDFHYDST